MTLPYVLCVLYVKSAVSLKWQVEFKNDMKITPTLYNAILRNIMHSKEFSGNQRKHQNFDPSILPNKFGLIFM